MPWFVYVIAFVVLGLAIGGIVWLLGHRFIREFTRPGVTVEYGTPEWGNWTFPDTAGEPGKELQRAVTFQAADGVLLRGEFWAQPHSAPTIILSHGFHFPSCYFRSVAALEYSHGVNILLFDYRGHGKSFHSSTTCGNAEVNDLAAAVEVAASQEETACGRVYIHGFSMGAAVALLLPRHAAIAGIIADSSYARLDEMIHLLMKQIFAQEMLRWRALAKVMHPLIPMLAHLTLFGGRLLFHARYHHSLIARPEQAISSQTTSTSGTLPPPLLLIHAENDPLIALHHAHRLVAVARASGRAVQAYYTPCAIHCGSYGYDPQQYMALLLTFMAL
ncbi:MAG TPA: alpha/beta fold hydrolase [Ktedonobacteraceae bacterium]